MEVKIKSRETAYMQLDHMLNRLAWVCIGNCRTMTNEEQDMLNYTLNRLMDMFTGYTIEYPSTHEECQSGQTQTTTFF